MSHIQPDTTLPKTPKIKIYTATITQGTTNPPVATIQQNTFGETLTWARAAQGQYTLTSTGQFTQGKVALLIQQRLPQAYNQYILWVSENVVEVRTEDTGVAQDSLLSNTTVEVRVYE